MCFNFLHLGVIFCGEHGFWCPSFSNFKLSDNYQSIYRIALSQGHSCFFIVTRIEKACMHERPMDEAKQEGHCDLADNLEWSYTCPGKACDQLVCVCQTIQN